MVSTLFINKDRLQYVDMTMPYLDVSLGVLIPIDTSSSGLFALFEPFEYSLWGVIMVITWFFGVLITLCSYFSPFGYRGRHVQRWRKEDKRFEAQKAEMNFHEGFWFSFASIMWQVRAYSTAIII